MRYIHIELLQILQNFLFSLSFSVDGPLPEEISPHQIHSFLFYNICIEITAEKKV